MDGSPQSGAIRRNHLMAPRCRRVGAVHSVKTGPRAMSAQCPLYTCERTSALHPVQPVAAIAAIRRTGFMEYWMGTAASVRLDAGKLHYLAPLLGFLGNEFPEIGRRA